VRRECVQVFAIDEHVFPGLVHEQHPSVKFEELKRKELVVRERLSEASDFVE
jgi:hypothetical protein